MTAVTRFIENSQFIVGYMRDLPTAEDLAAIAKLDYSAAILISTHATHKLIQEENEAYDELDGIAIVGGYALDNMRHDWDDFKRSFNVFNGSPNWEPTGAEFNTDFLVSCKVTEHGIEPLEGISFTYDYAGNAVVKGFSAGTGFNAVRKGLKEIKNKIYTR